MQGRIIYVMGASGSGKDSLLAYARERLAGDPRVAFAHRYITRPAGIGGENHVALSPAEFTARLEAGLFALNWECHGFSYGIGIEIDLWMEKGITVVVNSSRLYLPEARRRYSGLVPVLVEVSIEKIHERLIARSRETRKQVEDRLERHMSRAWSFEGCPTVNNDGPIHIGGEVLLKIIRNRMNGAA